jgi:hypothetical protein
MEHAVHLYLILHPNVALVGSQYPPEKFSEHYTSGSSRYYSGKVIFAELDPEFRHPFFPITEMLPEIAPHPDGRPKATKFISSYRVLEHIDLDSVRTLHLVNPEGDCMPIHAGGSCIEEKEDRVKIYAEIAPLRMLVLSSYGIKAFGDYITDQDNPKGAPTLFYTQIDLDIDAFLADFEKNPFRQAPIKSIHPSSLRDAYLEIKENPDKHTKGLCLDSSLDYISYRHIRKGFMFSSGGKNLCFNMPELSVIERDHYRFWKHM